MSLLWVSLKHDGTDGTAYKDRTAIQLLVEPTGQPIQTGQLVLCGCPVCAMNGCPVCIGCRVMF